MTPATISTNFTALGPHLHFTLIHSGRSVLPLLKANLSCGFWDPYLIPSQGLNFSLISHLPTSLTCASYMVYSCYNYFLASLTWKKRCLDITSIDYTVCLLFFRTTILKGLSILAALISSPSIQSSTHTDLVFPHHISEIAF